MKYVIDASMATKFFTREVGSKQAQDLLQSAATGNLELLAPTLLIYEVTTALVRKRYASPSLQRQRIRQLFEACQLSLIDLIDIDCNILIEAGEIAREVTPDNKRPWTADAIYHALARREGIQLLTADNVYIERVRGFTKYQADVVLLSDLA